MLCRLEGGSKMRDIPSTLGPFFNQNKWRVLRCKMVLYSATAVCVEYFFLYTHVIVFFCIIGRQL